MWCYSLSCNQYEFVAAYTDCNEYGGYYVDVQVLYRGYVDYIYLMMGLPFVHAFIVLVWHALNRSECEVV